MLQQTLLPQRGPAQPKIVQRKYRGVTALRNGRHRARVTIEGVAHDLGMYDSAEAAAAAYDRTQYELYGSRGNMNFKQHCCSCFKNTEFNDRVLLCDFQLPYPQKGTCDREYCFECIGVAKPPNGKWYCREHGGTDKGAGKGKQKVSKSTPSGKRKRAIRPGGSGDETTDAANANSGFSAAASRTWPNGGISVGERRPRARSGSTVEIDGMAIHSADSPDLVIRTQQDASATAVAIELGMGELVPASHADRPPWAVHSRGFCPGSHSKNSHAPFLRRILSCL